VLSAVVFRVTRAILWSKSDRMMSHKDTIIVHARLGEYVNRELPPIAVEYLVGNELFLAKNLPANIRPEFPENVIGHRGF
jgi:hypothetical protein